MIHPSELCLDEANIKFDIVSHQNRIPKHAYDVPTDIEKLRRLAEIASLDPMEPRRTEVTVGIDQSLVLGNDTALLVQSDDPDFDDPVVPSRMETGRL